MATAIRTSRRQRQNGIADGARAAGDHPCIPEGLQAAASLEGSAEQSSPVRNLITPAPPRAGQRAGKVRVTPMMIPHVREQAAGMHIAAYALPYQPGVCVEIVAIGRQVGEVRPKLVSRRAMQRQRLARLEPRRRIVCAEQVQGTDLWPVNRRKARECSGWNRDRRGVTGAKGSWPFSGPFYAHEHTVPVPAAVGCLSDSGSPGEPHSGHWHRRADRTGRLSLRAKNPRLMCFRQTRRSRSVHLTQIKPPGTGLPHTQQNALQTRGFL